MSAFFGPAFKLIKVKSNGVRQINVFVYQIHFEVMMFSRNVMKHPVGSKERSGKFTMHYCTLLMTRQKKSMRFIFSFSRKKKNNYNFLQTLLLLLSLTTKLGIAGSSTLGSSIEGGQIFLKQTSKTLYFKIQQTIMGPKAIHMQIANII